MGEITTMDMLSPPRQCRDSDSWHILNESPPVTPVKRWNDDGDGPDSAQRSPLRPLKGPKIASTEPVKQRKDRFIPRRSEMDLDVSLFNLTKNPTIAAEQDDYEKALSCSLLGRPRAGSKADNRIKSRVLNFSSGPVSSSQLQENEMASGSIWALARRDRDPLLSTTKQKPVRYIAQAPERILDAPELLDNFYLNLLDWSQRNIVAIALGQTVYMWNASTGAITQLKALAWCPFEPNLLASGGGTTDRKIRFWNAQSGACINTIDTKSQVCSLLWSKKNKELLSSHGFSQNQLTLWKYPTMSKVTELTGHTSRVLHTALSADGTTVVSAAADETLRFWKVFDDGNSSGKDREKPENTARASKHMCIR